MIINLVTGKFELDWKNLWELWQGFFREIKLNLSFMKAKIFAIAIFTGILRVI